MPETSTKFNSLTTFFRSPRRNAEMSWSQNRRFGTWYIKFAPCWELSLQYLWFVSTIFSKLMEWHLESDFRVLGHDGVRLIACSRSPEVVLYSDIHCLQKSLLIFGVLWRPLCYHQRGLFVSVSSIARSSGRNSVGLHDVSFRYGGHCCSEYM